MPNINPTALFLIAFCTGLSHCFGYSWVLGSTIGTGIVLAAEFLLILRRN